MAITSYTQEFTASIAPSKMFKALKIDSHNLIPKITPQYIKSIESVKGDGGVISIKQTNFAERGHLKYLKHRFDSLDTSNFLCKYTLIEGDAIFDKIESVIYEIIYEVKFEASSNGGCVYKMTSEYHTKAGVELKEEHVKQGKVKAVGFVTS
ncbi:major strawberry allergen Fra a 1.08-like [Eucalyptus grandis]|uniref:major strawberry allergen Fra a 1.08-like n=1 Tax=Eucalyptus grandis TaxID=71139 RepID=UPI00192EDAEE|nr:major strawberry allergen Fra a 1.08-like [Eucalyptus grandis]